ncbi:MAG: serine hydrolase [Bacteroidaceae bacterium]|nr:serine hydrolase [Bacteroidaceae bacterium]
MKKLFLLLSLFFAPQVVSDTLAQQTDATTGASQITDTRHTALRRKKPSKRLQRAFDAYLHAVDSAHQNLHSIMVLQHGRVVAERWLNGASPTEPHVLNSVSKTFTSMAVGLCIQEGRFTLDTPLLSFFPDVLPEPTDRQRRITVRHLLTMTCGHDTDPSAKIRNREDWIKSFLSVPVAHEPGERFCYNSMGTFMLSAIVQHCTGETVLSYLTPRLLTPLGIHGARWEENAQGINCGGWGLYLKTEDLARLGLLLLRKGKWIDGRQLLPAQWIEEASRKQVDCQPAGVKPEDIAGRGLTTDNSDWVQGYGFQLWRCRHNAFRADGAGGQYIIVLPEQDAVIVATAQLRDMQAELNLIWDYLLPALKK